MKNDKLVLVKCRDYPPEQYSVYWEIRIEPEAWEWGVRFYSYTDGQVVEETRGGAASETEARQLSQTWVLDHIEAYRR